MVATVLIRNATGSKVFYRDFVGLREDSPVCQFEVLDGQQKAVPGSTPKRPMRSKTVRTCRGPWTRARNAATR